jgi:hypothetical protein
MAGQGTNETSGECLVKQLQAERSELKCGKKFFFFFEIKKIKKKGNMM